MADAEGVKEAVQVSLKMMEMLQGLFGFTFNKTEKFLAFTGRGLGKGIRFTFHCYKSGKMLEGGEKTFQEIAKNRGSLDMAVSTVGIEDWNSEEGMELRNYLKNRGVQYVLLDDITKGDNRVQFMYHASDADRVNSLLAEYSAKHRQIKYKDAKSTADAYDDLPPEGKQEVNASFERGVTALDYKALQIPENAVWNYTEKMDSEKKREFISPANQKKLKFREVAVPEVNVKKDLARGIAFIRCGRNGYVVPLDCIQEEISGKNPENMETKMRCRIYEQGWYLKFENGVCSNVAGKELLDDLEHITTSLWKTQNQSQSHNRNHTMKELPHMERKEYKK